MQSPLVGRKSAPIVVKASDERKSRLIQEAPPVPEPLEVITEEEMTNSQLTGSEAYSQTNQFGSQGQSRLSMSFSQNNMGASADPTSRQTVPIAMDIVEEQATQDEVSLQELDDGGLQGLLAQSDRDQAGRIIMSAQQKTKQAAQLKKIKELGRKKQAKLLDVNRKRQASYFNQQQYRFYQTTNEQGALLDDEEDYGDEYDQDAPKSLWQMTQETANLCSWIRKLCRREDPDQEQPDLTQEMILDRSELLDDSDLVDELGAQQLRRQTKKRVVPNNNQDKWLVYLLQNLNKANDLPWVEELLNQIEQIQDEFNAGKFRGAVFQMNFVAKEQLTSRHMTMRLKSGSLNVNHSSSNLGRLLAGQSIMDSLVNNKKLHDSVNQELAKRMSSDESEDGQTTDPSQLLADADSTSNAAPSIAHFAEMSQVQFGLSSASTVGDPLSYATRLCRLLKNSDVQDEGQDVQTLDNLRGMVRQIFQKIREQLDDETHPIIWIISQFQEAFRRYIEDEIAAIQNSYVTEEAAPYQSVQAVGLAASGEPQTTSYRPVNGDEMDQFYVINRGSQSNASRSHSDSAGHDYYNSLSENTQITRQEMFSSPTPKIKNDSRAFSNRPEEGDQRADETQINQSFTSRRDPIILENENFKTPLEEALQDLAEEGLRQVSQFLILLCSCCVRFYSTVVDWEYINRMREDLIERMTSKLFERPSFSNLIIQLCGELTREDDEAYKRIKSEFIKCKPKDVGINPYFTLDHTSKIEQVFMQLHPELNLGDSGSIEGQGGNSSEALITSHISNEPTMLAAIPEEIMSERSTMMNSRREDEMGRPQRLSADTNELLGMASAAESASLSEIRRRMHSPDNLPYRRCVDQLNKMNKQHGVQTPLQKMNCIAEISSVIKKEVQEFWGGVDVDQRKLTLDAEQITMIYQFIAIKAEANSNIFAQIKFCNEFSTPFIRNMKQGFCLVTLEMALKQLIQYPEMIGAADQDEENDQHWQERTRSIGSSFRQSMHAQKSNTKQSAQFNLAVPQNILAPTIQLDANAARQSVRRGGSARLSGHVRNRPSQNIQNAETNNAGQLPHIEEETKTQSQLLI